MKKCLDEAVMQAYLDGELAPGAARAAAAHLATCGACAASLAEVEAETAFLASSFAPDAAVSVPTEILRARVVAAVAQLEAEAAVPPRRPRGWDFGALLAPFTGLLSFTPQRVAAFAGVLAVVAFAVVFLAVRERTTPSGGDVVRVEHPAPAPAPTEATRPTGAGGEVKIEQPAQVPAPAADRLARIEKASAKRPAAAHKRPASSPAAETVVAATPAAEVLVPGEKNYREAIASLEQVVRAGGDAVLAPKARIQYERNIAVLDRAIEETRAAALRNPKDRDAVGFLLTAYQSKVELLSAVADQTQIAAVGR